MRDRLGPPELWPWIWTIAWSLSQTNYQSTPTVYQYPSRWIFRLQRIPSPTSQIVTRAKRKTPPPRRLSLAASGVSLRTCSHRRLMGWEDPRNGIGAYSSFPSLFPQAEKSWCSRTSINWTPSPEPEYPAHLPSVLALSSEQITSHDPAKLVSPSPSLCSLSSTSPESWPGPPPSISKKRGCAEFDGDTLKDAITSPPHVSVHGVRKRRLSQSDSPVPTKRQCRPSTPPRRHSIINPTPPSDEFPDLSFPQNRTTDPDEVPQPTPQVSVNPDESLNLRVFDWNSIPDPLAETVSSLCM